MIGLNSAPWRSLRVRDSAGHSIQRRRITTTGPSLRSGFCLDVASRARLSDVAADEATNAKAGFGIL